MAIKQGMFQKLFKEGRVWRAICTKVPYTVGDGIILASNGTSYTFLYVI